MNSLSKKVTTTRPVFTREINQQPGSSSLSAGQEVGVRRKNGPVLGRDFFYRSEVTQHDGDRNSSVVTGQQEESLVARWIKKINRYFDRENRLTNLQMAASDFPSEDVFYRYFFSSTNNYEETEKRLWALNPISIKDFTQQAEGFIERRDTGIRFCAALRSVIDKTLDNPDTVKQAKKNLRAVYTAHHPDKQRFKGWDNEVSRDAFFDVHEYLNFLNRSLRSRDLSRNLFPGDNSVSSNSHKEGTAGLFDAFFIGKKKS